MTAPARNERACTTTGPQPPGTALVVTPHCLASEAACVILDGGGNAVDAAIAANAVLGVVLPDTCGPGGDLFALLHLEGSETPIALNASGRAGSGIDADRLRDHGLGSIPRRSPWSVTVPGCVDGWIALSARHGELGLAACLEPAIAIARQGFPVSRELAAELASVAGLLVGQPSARSLYPNGEAPAEGTGIQRPLLAETLEGIATTGRDGFYRGAVAAGITEASKGAITPDDLIDNTPDWIEPISCGLFRQTGWTIPPNSQGYLTLATLAVFDLLDPPDDPLDPLFHHLLIESYRSVAWERAAFVSDARTAPHDPATLLAQERLSAIAATIDPGRAGRWPHPAPAPKGTAYLAVADAKGLTVSLIQSNFSGIGAGLTAGDTGVFLHNRGAGFTLIQGHPNEYAPGKRPLHTLAPTLWTSDRRATLALGTRGGDQQPQFLAQFAALHHHAGLCIDDAQQFPRWSMRQPAPGTDSHLVVESRLPDRAIASLTELGHRLESTRAWHPDFGPVSAADLGRDRAGAADPRVSTSTALAAPNRRA